VTSNLDSQVLYLDLVELSHRAKEVIHRFERTDTLSGPIALSGPRQCRYN